MASKNKYNTRQKLKKGGSDPDNSPDKNNIVMINDGSDDGSDYETVSETETETDSTYTPPTKSNKNKSVNKSTNKSVKTNKHVQIDEEDDDDTMDEEDEEDEEDTSDNDDDESSAVDPRELRKTIAVLFPSNYINSKVKADEKITRSSKFSKRSTSSKRGKKKAVDSSDDDEEYDEEQQNKDYNIIFTALGGNDRDAQDETAIQDDADEECNSEDEKTFMKETYEPITIPTIKLAELENTNGKNSTNVSKKSSKLNKHNTSKNSTNSSEDVEPVDAASEYNELVELKRHLLEKLDKKPKSKILIHAIDECSASIKKLVKKTRMKNAKKYYKMVNEDIEQNTSEIDYFKTKLSNKEQMRAMKELKTINDHISIKKPYRLTLLDSNIPPKYKATVMQKLNMLRSMEPGDPEYYKLKTWVDTFMRIPFCVNKSLSVNIKDGIDVCSAFMENAKQILDECVYGLNDAKMQIMQMVGQWITNPSAMGSAIAIKGPMGTGKTTLVKEGISRILGREFAFIALGGTGDASFLEGHSYTYEGSLWGKIVQILIDSKCMNPVIYFDELDKVSDTPRGEEIIGVLTHLTDTTQNNQFHDKYFSEIDFDLSKCLFIFSYNDESKVNPILRDRMYRIQTKGYDAKEKMIIARNYLLPKIREQVSFTSEDVDIPDETLQAIIANKSITREEDGVRNLKRCLEIIHTKLNLFRLMKPENNLFSKDMDMTVSFPYSVNKKAVDKLIKNEENQNQSLLAMYC